MLIIFLNFDEYSYFNTTKEIFLKTKENYVKMEEMPMTKSSSDNN